MTRWMYSLLLYCLLPLAPIKLLWRGLRQPAYWQHWRERFGWYAGPPLTPVIWLHCVSVGETRAAAPLVKLLQTQYPAYRILISHTTPTGRATSEQLFGDTVLRTYLPYDVPGAVARFLRHFQPAIGLILETELWFNLIATCRQRQIPLLLVNARLSERSARGYAKVPDLTREGLRNLAGIAAQTEQDKARLESLGAEGVTVCGNLKFDVEPPADAADRGAELRKLFSAHAGANRPVLLAASTRDGEETLILDAIKAAAVPQLLTLIVPRHPERFSEVAHLLKQRHIPFLLRSRLKTEDLLQDVPRDSAQTHVTPASGALAEVILGDSMGEMFAYYAACDAAFIGGSLQPYGGQNLIEACAMGKPVLIGPHTFNFEAATEQAIASRAAWRIQDVDTLALAIRRLFSDPEGRQAMGWAALAFSRSAGGAVHRIGELVAKWLVVP